MIIFIHYCGNLFNFESLSSSNLTGINILMSLPLILVFEADNYYALVNG